MKKNYPLPSVVVKKNTTTLTTKTTIISYLKMLSEVVIRCRQKKYDNIDNKCNGSFLPQKMLSEVVVNIAH